jgi:hypothetical protein
LEPGVAVITYPARGRNAYYVERGLPVQVELYDPTPGRAARILRNAKLRAVPSELGVANRPTEATLAALTALPESVGHPVYWAGARRDSKYELTQTSEGLYIRYLPKHVAVGDRSASFLTVASYPSGRTFAQEEARARRAGSVIRNLGGGRKSIEPVGQSTSAYLIVRGQDVLVEVYSPVPGQAARLSARGTIVPLG